MRTPAKLICAASALATVLGTLAYSAQAVAAADGKSMIEQGRQIAFDRKKGNCLACHVIAGGSLPGNVGPPLVGIKARYPDKAKLRAQIWDATKNNANTPMPPFGRNEILTESEVDKVVEFVDSL